MFDPNNRNGRNVAFTNNVVSMNERQINETKPNYQKLKSLDPSMTSKKLGLGGNGLIVIHEDQKKISKLSNKTMMNKYIGLLSQLTGRATPSMKTVEAFLRDEEYFVPTRVKKTPPAKIEMNYVDGLDLNIMLIQRTLIKPLDASIIRFILSHALRALNKLHQVGFVHLDIKPDNIMIQADLQLKIIDYDHMKDATSGINSDFGTAGYIRYQHGKPSLNLTGLMNKNRSMGSRYSPKEEDYFALAMTVFLLMVAPFEKEPLRLIDKLNESSSFHAYCRESSYEQWLDRLKQVHERYRSQNPDYYESSEHSPAKKSDEPDHEIFEVLATLFEYKPENEKHLKKARCWASLSPQPLITEMHMSVIPFIIGMKLKSFKEDLIKQFEMKKAELFKAFELITNAINLKDLEKWFNELPDDCPMEVEWSIEKMIYFVVRSLIGKVEYRIKSMVLKLTAPDEDVFLKVDTTIRFKIDKQMIKHEHKFIPECTSQTADQQDALISNLREVYGVDYINDIHRKEDRDPYTTVGHSKTEKYADASTVIKGVFDDILKIESLADDHPNVKSTASDSKERRKEIDANWCLVERFYDALPSLMLKMTDMLLLLSDRISMQIGIDEGKLCSYLSNKYPMLDIPDFSKELAEQIRRTDKIYCSPINSVTLQQFADSCFLIRLQQQSPATTKELTNLRRVIEERKNNTRK